MVLVHGSSWARGGGGGYSNNKNNSNSYSKKAILNINSLCSSQIW